MSSLRRTYQRAMKRKTSGRYCWGYNGNRKSRRTKKKEK